MAGTAGFRGGDEAEGLEAASTVVLIGRLLEQTSAIIRQEPALARAEFTLKAKRATVGVMLSAGAAVTAAIALLCAAGAAVAALAALAGVLPVWAAALVVAGAFVAVAVVAGLVAARAFAEAAPSTPPDALSSVRADLTEVKERFRP